MRDEAPLRSEPPPSPVVEPGRLDRLFNAAVGGLVRWGIGPSHMRLLEVRGRRTGRIRSLPVDVLDEGGALFLVAPRGRTQWVRNAEAETEVSLRRGRRSARFGLRPVPDAEKPRILKAYLDRFQREVQRFFPVAAGSPTEAFVPLAGRYPAFELLPVARTAADGEPGAEARPASELPDLAEILAPLLGRVPPERRPLVVALAERLAAERYRRWAADPACGASRSALLACARREERIADRVEALYPDASALQREIRAGGPDLEEIDARLFADRPLREQWTLQARGERLGAATWRAFARDADDRPREAFEACALLEEESAVALERILGSWR